MISKRLFTKINRVQVMTKKQLDLIRNPTYNQGHAFTVDERNRLGLRGLLMDIVADQEYQLDKIQKMFDLGWAKRAAIIDKEIMNSGVNPDNVRKWNILQNLQDSNETLFYRLIMDNFMTMAPIIYTPTVGWACSNYSILQQRPRGMIFSQRDRGEMAAMLHNWPEDEIKAVVVTDGSRILGLGDLGVGGIQICIGKLDLYVAGGGFHPRHVLPIVLDVGTNNQKLIDDPNYFGVKKPRLDNEEYYEFFEEFVQAVRQRYPKVLIQFEDFQFKHAIRLLNLVYTLTQYRDEKKYLCFNDDIQGTASTILAGLMGAMKATHQDISALTKQRYLVCGAGSAGAGAIDFVHGTLVDKYGMDPQDAAKLFYVVDKDGLISKSRKNLQELKQNFANIELYSQDNSAHEGLSIEEVVDEFKPTVLIGNLLNKGLSAVGGLFTESIVKKMAKNNDRPIIFALSNPTSKSEAKAEDVQNWTNGRAIFASGSPFKDVIYNGQTLKSSQCNNSYIFPGLALGAQLCQTKTITDNQFRAASEGLVDFITDNEIQISGCVMYLFKFPKLKNIREFSCHLACRVIQKAVEENLAQCPVCIEKTHKGEEELKEYIKSQMWQPEYRTLIYKRK